MTESVVLGSGKKYTLCSLGSREFHITANIYSNRVFVAISERSGEIGTIFSVRKDSPLPDSALGNSEEIYTIKTLFGAESIELLFAARVLGQVIGQLTDKPQLLALALLGSSKQTLSFLTEELKALLTHEAPVQASTSTQTT